MCVKWQVNTGKTLSQLDSVVNGYALYTPEPTTDTSSSQQIRHRYVTNTPPSLRITLSPKT